VPWDPNLRKAALAMSRRKTKNYRLSFSSERANYYNKSELSKIIKNRRRKIGIGFQIGA
jgi:hypothetical protein